MATTVAWPTADVPALVGETVTDSTAAKSRFAVADTVPPAPVDVAVMTEDPAEEGATAVVLN